MERRGENLRGRGAALGTVIVPRIIYSSSTRIVKEKVIHNYSFWKMGTISPYASFASDPCRPPSSRGARNRR